MAYTSKQLTHFVGRGEVKPIPLDDQFQKLCAILKTQCMSKHPDRPEVMDPIDIYPVEKICDDRMFRLDAVCFCDIPLKDFRIHMKKYGKIGIAFLKSFLVRKGACPVFYVTKDSALRYDFTEGAVSPKQEMPRGRMFDTQISRYFKLHQQRRGWVAQDRQVEPDIAEHLSGLSGPTWFFYYHVFGFIKCFDSTLRKDHREHFYMEREWRVAGGFRFELSDVHRVVLPATYHNRFREEFPSYQGKLTDPARIRGTARRPGRTPQKRLK